ncbi:MAG: uncharacterized protein K0R98_2029, partial [Rickettsiaceae bacterium]|nr:uncharacterized protein [Rickettsiaceae bacterium]
LVASNQAQKEVTVNTAIATIDALLNRGASDRAINTPPGSPAEGDLYIIGGSPTGDWSGYDDEIAYYQSGWKFIIPNEGMTIWVNDEDLHYTWDGAAWSTSGGGGGAASLDDLSDVDITTPANYDILQYDGANFVNQDKIDNIAQVGINTASDATNKLTVKSDAVLFDNDGDDSRVKVNKDAAADTASHLFQSGYSGRAEFGLVGDDDFQVKVSSDGSSWHQSYVVDKSTGNIDFKQNVNITGGAISGIVAGSGSATISMAGAINVQYTPVGNVGAGEDDLMSYTLPANSLSAAGKLVRVFAWGTGANNGNSKTVKAYIGGTQINSASLLASAAGVWRCEFFLVSSGADTQSYFSEFIRLSATAVDVAVREQGALSKDDGAGIILKFTGTATSNDDITQNGMIVEFMN